MATGVEASHAVRIALNLKKMLVDGGLLELTQAQLEERLFDLMQNEYSSHYGPTNVHYYRLFSRQVVRRRRTCDSTHSLC